MFDPSVVTNAVLPQPGASARKVFSPTESAAFAQKGLTDRLQPARSWPEWCLANSCWTTVQPRVSRLPKTDAGEQDKAEAVGKRRTAGKEQRLRVMERYALEGIGRR